jgi:ABC-type glycerol-3-phosphate transport system substrate-binding protein
MDMRIVLLSSAAAFAAATGVGNAQEISFSVMESGTYDTAAEEIAAELAADGGPTVEVSAFPWAVLRQNNTTDLISATNQYDVMSGGYYLADVYSYFQPVDDLVERDTYSDGMIENVLSPGRSEYLNGRLVGIPYGIDGYGLLVNTDLLDQAGLETTFDSWQDLIDACPTIEEATGVACLSHPTGAPEQIGAFFFADYPGTYVNADGTYALETEAAVAAAERIVELWKFLPENGTAMSFDEAHAAFRNGEAAVLVTWPSFVTNSLDTEDSPLKGKWAMTEFPGEGFPWLSMWQMFMPASTTDRDAAWEFMKAYAGPENATRNLTEHNIGSVWTATYEDAALAAERSHYWPALTAGFANAKNPPLSGEAQDFLTNTLQDVANGRTEAAAAIESVNSAWASIPVPPALLEAAMGSDLAAE